MDCNGSTTNFTGINVTTVLRVVNRPVEAIVVHKADNATVLHGKITGKEMVGKAIHA